MHQIQYVGIGPNLMNSHFAIVDKKDTRMTEIFSN